MKHTSIFVPIYDWDIKIVSFEGKESKSDMNIFDCISKDYHLTKEEHELVLEELKNESHDGGETFYDCSKMSILVVLYPSTTEKEFIGVLNHEKRHVVDIIAETIGLECKESVAYLDEYISKGLYTLKDSITNIIK